MTYVLLSNPTDNPKVSKNLKLKVYTAPLHLAPYNISGFQVCPKASTGCAAACLHTAGNPAFMKNKEKARIRKTLMYFNEREKFLETLKSDIEKLVKNTPKEYTTGVRLNATSDIPWERHRDTIMDLFPSVMFYDYTKIKKRLLQGYSLPSNYHLTFSASESNDAECKEVLDNGGNVTVVFKTKEFPETFWGYPVVNGDEHDYRPADPKNVIVGLAAKGKARSDTSGFVKSVLDS